MPRGIEQAHSFFSAAVKEFPYWKDTLKPALETALSSYIGDQASIQLNPLIQSIEDWLRQQLLLSFAAETSSVLTPLDRMGDGFQSLVRLAALQVLAGLDEPQSENIVLLYEEPETYLHPHLRRKLRNILDLLAKKGWCIFCATHAPEFVSYEKEQSIHRLLRTGELITHGIVLTSSVPNSLKLQEKLDEYGNHEIFFAQKIVFCEGKDDVFAIRSYLEKSKLDLEARSFSILGCDGIENMPDFVDIAISLKIPFCAITDVDKSAAGTINSRTDKVRKAISAKLSDTDCMAEWDNTLEDCLQTPFKQNGIDRRKALPTWQRDYIGIYALSDIRSKYPGYMNVCESIITWLIPRS